MYRRLSVLFLVLFLLQPCFSMGEMEVEELDVDITELVQIAEEESVREKKDSDGAFIMTVTCTGDFTIGGDNYHHNDIFAPELKSHDGDINFVMQNTRGIFLDDDLTILNFEGNYRIQR